jgi:HPt (histidine-containing phosphotransfer) domain-containing protein
MGRQWVVEASGKGESIMIDWSRVEELFEEVGEEDFVEIVALFLSELQESVDSLDGLAKDQSLCDALHGIKGSASNLGFKAVSELCAAGERDPMGFDSTDLRTSMGASIDALTDRYKAVL